MPSFSSTARLRRFVAIVLLAAPLLVIATARPSSAAVAPAAAEAQFLSLINASRQANGLGALAPDAALAGVARAWSASMSAVHQVTGDPVIKPLSPNNCALSSLCHRPDLVAAVAAIEPKWALVGENIGYGFDVAGLHDAFMRSPGHKANILGKYNRVGIGVVLEGSAIWVTVDFLQGPALTGAEAPGQAQPVDPPPVATPPVAPLQAGKRFQPVPPVRLADSRTGQGFAAGLVRAGGTARLELAGRPPLPAAARGVVVNLTATDAQGVGYVTAYPCGSGVPTTSTLNVQPGQTVANLLVTPLDGTGDTCVFTSVPVHLVVDLAGWLADSGIGYDPADPRRLLDTRQLGGRRTIVQVPLAGVIPAGASAITVNLTVTDPAGPGYVTAFDCATAQPWASNLNYGTGQTVANLATVAVPAGGTLCVATLAPAHLVVDLAGSWRAGGGPVTVATPGRFLDTRNGTGGWLGQVGTMQRIELKVGGAHGVPAGATAAVVNLTVTNPAAAGYLVAYPCGGAMPVASNVNFAARTTAANLAVVRLPADGKVCLTASTRADVIVDLAGWS
jgi:hypothetical protein